MAQHRPTIGLALGSGGARGLAHIGVIRALETHGIPIDYIAGTSIGSIMGAHYAAFPDHKKLLQLAYDFSNRKGFSLVDLTLRGGLIKGLKIESIISEILEGATFETLKIPFAAVATDFNTAQEVILRTGDLTKAIRASISVPGFFQPVHYEGRLLADGGLSQPVPSTVVRSMGADIVIAVNLDTISGPGWDKEIPPLSSVPMHSINILRHHLSLQSSQTADIIISPEVYQVGLIGWNYFFDIDKVNGLIDEGHAKTEMIMPMLKKRIEEKTKQTNRLTSFFFKILKIKV